MVENVFANFFPKRMNIIDIRLSGFCTNEVGFLLDTSLCDSSSRNAAIIGNPLRHVSFDDNSETKLLNFTGSANLIDKNCNGKYLSIVSGPNICVFDLHKGAILREFHGHDGAILNVAWHHTNPWLLASVGIDSTLRLWDLRLHPAQLQMRRTPRPFTCLEYSPDCSYIACGGQIISVFDLNMSQSVQYMPCTSPTTNIRFNPAECLLATSHEDHSICFWDIDTGECVTQSPSFDSKVGQICFPPDGKYLIVNNGKKICTIQWEPFQLISQVLFPFCGHFPSHNISIQFPNKSEEYTPLTHLDMKVRDELIFGLSIVNEDSQKIGTACLSTIRLDKLDCYSTDNSTILDCVEYTSKSIDYENNDFEIQDQFDVTQITAQEKTSAAIIQESSLASDKLVKNVESVEELAPKTLIQNRPTALVLSDNISTSFESAGSICHSSSASARSSIYNLLSPTAIHNKNISSKINCKTIKQQKESLKASTELKSNNLSGKRPNKLPLINQNQQKHLDSYNCHEGQKPSNYNPNQLFRRGSSLTDVSDPAKNNNNMPIENNRHKSESDSGDELEEFLQFDPKVRANILKRVRDIKAVFTRSNRINGDTCEFIIKETIRFDDILAYAFLLKQYMDRGSFSMSSNELFLSRADALLVHRNKSYIQLGLNFLNMVTSRFGNAILHGLASQEFIIGVDVEAEKRFERCTKCKNALFQIRLNTAFNMERMTFAQRNLFEKEILPRIDEIVNAERSPDVRHFSNNT